MRHGSENPRLTHATFETKDRSDCAILISEKVTSINSLSEAVEVTRPLHQSRKMSLWKVLNKSQIVRQVNASEIPAGSFVWGKEGFKWISGNTEKKNSSAGVQPSQYTSQGVESEQEQDQLLQTSHQKAS